MSGVTAQDLAVRSHGLIGTILVAVAALAVQYAVILGVMAAASRLWPQSVSTPTAVSPVVFAGTLIAVPFQLLVLVAATRSRGGWKRYLGIKWPAKAAIPRALAVGAVLVVGSDALTLAIGREIVPPFMRDAYLTARTAGSLPLLIAAIAVAAPVWEECLFRGFLYRGLAATRLGPIGAVVISALAWSVIHIQYDWYGVVQIFVTGIVFGGIRMRTGSVPLTIVLHGLVNLFATFETFLKVEGLMR